MVLYFILILLTFIFLVEAPILLNFFRHCFHAWDLGIYGQALQKISASDLNPWIPIRNIRIFNDHFDPILLAFSPLTRWVQPALAVLMIECAFILGSGFLLFHLGKKNRLNTSVWVTLCLLLFFHAGTIQAMTFPGHPATWAVFPLILLSISIAWQKPWAIVLTMLGLFLFKEEFIFLGIVLAGHGFYRKKIRLALLLVALSLSWAIFVFYLRPLFLGTTTEYASEFLKPWLEQPIEALKTSILNLGMLKKILLLLLPFLPLAYWTKKNKIKLNAEMLLCFLCLLGIRLITKRWGYHYDIALTATLVGVFLTSALQACASIRFPQSRSLVAFTAVLLLGFQLQFLGKYRRMSH